MYIMSKNPVGATFRHYYTVIKMLSFKNVEGPSRLKHQVK